MGDQGRPGPHVQDTELNNAVSNFFDLSKPSVDQQTRQTLIAALTERANMPQDQATATVQRWEQSLGGAKARYQQVAASLTEAANAAASGLAKGFRLPGIAGSDAHTRDEGGRAATRFAYPVTTDTEWLRELLAGRYEAAAVER